jgi:tRNA-splicing ligase RtcB
MSETTDSKENKIETITVGNMQLTTGYGVPVKAWTVGIDVEDHAWAQIKNVASMPFIYKWLAIMPDVHAGYGATVGSVIPTISAVSPMMVGVDIGCGMMASRTTLRGSQIEKRDLATLRQKIEAAVPHGLTKGRDKGSWGSPPENTQIAWLELEPGYKKILDKNPRASHKGPEAQLGTLGTGNHFIEICVDKEDYVWIMLHSGSRGVGNRMASHFYQVAKKKMEMYFISWLPDIQLAYLPEGTAAFDQYIEAANWCQRYARVNRDLMMENVQRAMRQSKLLPKFQADETLVDCHHNYVTKEHHYGKNIWVTRKGAVNASKGRLGIIPGSMGAKSYIVEGLGEAESFNSCSHGAGRKMSRTVAKNTFTLKDHRAATDGIECKKDSSVLDETPGAYKSISDVMEAQRDLVRPVHELRQVLCVKG